jgi:hypothetical protein
VVRSLAGLLVLGAGAGPVRAAETESLPPAARLELQMGAGWRQDTLALALLDASASGGALSDVAGRASWFAGDSHIGLAAQLAASRFALTAPPGAVAPDRASLTGLEAVAAVAGRARAGAHLGFEGQLGYGLFQLPAALMSVGPAGNVGLLAGKLRGHGPNLDARARLTAGRVAVELGGEWLPRLFGADYGSVPVELWRLGGRAGAGIELAELGAARWAAWLEYQLAHTRMTGDGVDIRQRRQLIALGLRASWGHARPAPPPVVKPPPPPVVAPPKPPPPAPSAISVLVRAEDGQPIQARITVPELGLDIQTDAAGSFLLQVEPGQYTLNIEAEGFLPQSKQISAGAGERRIYNIDLQREPR